MDRDRVSIAINDDEIWEQRKARLKARPATLHHDRTVLPLLYPLLYVAIEGGDVEKFIDALQEHSTKEGVYLSDFIKARGPSGNSWLHVAADIENPDILRLLLEVIPDEQRPIDERNSRGDTALHIAARAGRIRSAELLLRCGSNVDVANGTGDTPLHEAVKNGNHELTDLLLRRGSKSVYKENSESKCPLYLAVEAGDSVILQHLLEAVDSNDEYLGSSVEGMSPVHGAVMHRRLEMLKEMSKRKKELFDLEDATGGTPLHLAAYANYVDGVKFLVDEFPSGIVKKDNETYLPIHVACKMGHLEIIKELLRRWPDPEELLAVWEGQNILHVAAMYGRAPVVKYILGNPKLEKLINLKDKRGNTPLHVATSMWQPGVLLLLTRDKRVNLELVNNENSTALDIVDEELRTMDAPLHKILTQIILVSAGTRKSKDKAICRAKRSGPREGLAPPKLDQLKHEANTRMVVATLVAAMTFAAGLSVPGGYNGSEPDAGIATLLNKAMYKVFVICNSVAMYSSTIAVVILLWSQIPDPNAAHHALRKARLPLMLALATMSIAFTAGVYVTVNKHTWIAAITLAIGIAALLVFLSLYFAMYVRLGHYPRLVQFFTDYIIMACIRISKDVTDGRADKERELHPFNHGPPEPKKPEKPREPEKPPPPKKPKPLEPKKPEKPREPEKPLPPKPLEPKKLEKPREPEKPPPPPLPEPQPPPSKLQPPPSEPQPPPSEPL